MTIRENAACITLYDSNIIISLAEDKHADNDDCQRVLRIVSYIRWLASGTIMKTRGGGGRLVLLIHVLTELWLTVDGSKFTTDELLCSIYPKKTSNDVDLDPCKAGK